MFDLDNIDAVGARKMTSKEVVMEADYQLGRSP